MQVTVVGAGVIGLSSAIRLAEAGHQVNVVAAARTPNTTSDVAAAIHFPYLAEPRQRILGWAARSLDVFRDLQSLPDSGVQWRESRIVQPKRDPWWADLVEGFIEYGPDPDGHAYGCRLPVVAMPTHMRFLENWATNLGVTLTVKRLASLGEIRGVDAIVNASGLGARELAQDATMFPIQGQVVRVQAPNVTQALLVESDPPTYAVPRGDGVVVGGSAVVGTESLVPDDDLEADILRRACLREPGLVGAPVQARAVGLRPGRPTIRLDRDTSGPVPVVHCYGHGGSGVTLSWGCADDVLRLVEAP